jgi:hypothetical protein
MLEKSVPASTVSPGAGATILFPGCRKAGGWNHSFAAEQSGGSDSASESTWLSAVAPLAGSSSTQGYWTLYCLYRRLRKSLARLRAVQIVGRGDSGSVADPRYQDKILSASPACTMPGPGHKAKAGSSRFDLDGVGFIPAIPPTQIPCFVLIISMS